MEEALKVFYQFSIFPANLSMKMAALVWFGLDISSSPLKPLNGIQPNLHESKQWTSSIKFVFRADESTKVLPIPFYWLGYYLLLCNYWMDLTKRDRMHVILVYCLWGGIHHNVGMWYSGDGIRPFGSLFLASFGNSSNKYSLFYYDLILFPY